MTTRLSAEANAKAMIGLVIVQPAAVRCAPRVNVTNPPSAINMPATMDDTKYPSGLFSSNPSFPFAALHTL